MSGDQIWPILLGISVVLNLLLLLRRPILSWLHRDKGEELANEIMAMVEEGEESGAIERNEKELIENVFEFNNTTAEDVMIHRTDMVMLWVDDTAEEIAQDTSRDGVELYYLPAEGAQANQKYALVIGGNAIAQNKKECPKSKTECPQRKGDCPNKNCPKEKCDNPKPCCEKNRDCPNRK